MKQYNITFYRLGNSGWVHITILARDLEAAISRVKKELNRLGSLEDSEGKWQLYELKEANKAVSNE